MTWPGIWQHVDLYGATRPVLMSSILGFNAINFPAVFYDSRTVFLLIVVGFPFVPLGLVAVRRWLGPVVSRMSPVGRAFGITGGLLLAAAPASIAFELITPSGQWDHLYSTAVVIEMLFLGWVTALGTAAIREIDTVNDELVAVQDRLRWTVARTRLLQWYQQRQLSRALHGPVQTALHAAVRRIQSAVDDGLATSEAIRTERDRLEDAVIGTLAPAEAVADVRTGLLDTAALWDGLVTLEVDIADGTVATLATDPACAVIVADIAQEAVSNAIRHGNAGFVSVEVGSLATDRIELTVVNDGSALDTGTTTTGTASTGLGTQQLDECSVEWSRESTAAGSALRAVLPLEAAPRQAAREVSAADTDRRFGLRAQRSVRR